MYLLDLMHDKNPRVQKVCRLNLQIIVVGSHGIPLSQGDFQAESYSRRAIMSEPNFHHNAIILQECDPVWAERIKEEQFTSYNKQWLEAIQQNLPNDVYDDGVPDVFLDYNGGPNGYFTQNMDLLLRTADFSDSDGENSGSDQYLMPEKRLFGQSSEDNSPMNPKVPISNFSSGSIHHQQPSSNSSRPQTGYKKRTSIQ